MNRISATIIADSLNEFGNRLTTFVLVFPRIVLAELNTHRMLSRNSASSRAIPFKTMLKKVQEEPFIPIAFQKEHTGMQGNEYFEGEDLDKAKKLWLEARDYAVTSSAMLSLHKVTKQLCNRLLEPFLYHTVICTASEWENFFALRAHPQAEIHIADLAEKMLVAYNESEPKKLKAGEYHIPFGDTFDTPRLYGMVDGMRDNIQSSTGIIPDRDKFTEEIKVKIATARCARVSYLNFEGKDDYKADLKLFDLLSSSGHWSPFEHCARAMSEEEYDTYTLDVPRNKVNPNRMVDRKYGVCGNFVGFIQVRKEMQGENKTDNRIIKNAKFKT